MVPVLEWCVGLVRACTWFWFRVLRALWCKSCLTAKKRGALTTASGLQNPTTTASRILHFQHNHLDRLFFASRYKNMVIHELELSLRRETQVVEMMRLPPDENGMGCKLDFDAFAEIEKRTTEVILLLHERG